MDFDMGGMEPPKKAKPALGKKPVAKKKAPEEEEKTAAPKKLPGERPGTSAKPAGGGGTAKIVKADDIKEEDVGEGLSKD